MERDATGRYHGALGIALAPDADRLRVFDPAGQPVLEAHERLDTLVRQAGEPVAQADEIARLRRELDQLRQDKPGTPPEKGALLAHGVAFVAHVFTLVVTSAEETAG